MKNIAYQLELPLPIPKILGPKEYEEFRSQIEMMDRLLIESGIEQRIVSEYVFNNYSHLSCKQKQHFMKETVTAFRCVILLNLLDCSLREMSNRLCEGHLCQWFTKINRLRGIKVPSKSSLNRYQKMFGHKLIEELIHKLNASFADKKKAEELLYQEAAIRFDKIFADSTCIKAHIHYPVDWLLLRDGVRTLLAGIKLIRAQGILNRMKSPQSFMSRMNKLAMKMTQCRRTKDAKKKRKTILREMKRLTKKIMQHSEIHINLLRKNKDKTDYSDREVQVLCERLERISKKMPQAIKNAHERIIGGRKVLNKDKSLSLYDADAHVIVRGKAGAEIEYGNALYLAEQENGIIVDWNFMKNKPTADSKLVDESLKRITAEYGKPSSYTTDRGFYSLKNDALLDDEEIFNAICPKPVAKLEEKLEDEEFCLLQKRRASTEARIAVLKRKFIGRDLHTQDVKNKRDKIVWSIFTHNLWKFSKIANENLAQQKKIKAG